MDCIDNCSQGAISYRKRSKVVKAENEVTTDSSRRKFFTIVSAFALTSVVKAQHSRVDGGLAAIAEKKVPARKGKLTPPGSLSIRNLAQHCTACQLCIAACPNGVLRPSSKLDSLMQPEMGYERGYCRPECNACSQACPNGAIRPITLDEKTSIQIGHAVWIKENCIINTDGVRCGNCARHCPNGAIKMMPQDENNPQSPYFPVIDAERCIGCGACEYVCPARPFSAIYVEGNSVHRSV